MLEALQISVITMAVVFLALAGLTGALYCLQRVGREPYPDDSSEME
ncbi:MAG: OadG family protein [Mycobacterium leprae]